MRAHQRLLAADGVWANGLAFMSMAKELKQNIQVWDETPSGSFKVTKFLYHPGVQMIYLHAKDGHCSSWSKPVTQTSLASPSSWLSRMSSYAPITLLVGGRIDTDGKDGYPSLLPVTFSVWIKNYKDVLKSFDQAITSAWWMARHSIAFPVKNSWPINGKNGHIDERSHATNFVEIAKPAVHVVDASTDDDEIHEASFEDIPQLVYWFPLSAGGNVATKDFLLFDR